MLPAIVIGKSRFYNILVYNSATYERPLPHTARMYQDAMNNCFFHHDMQISWPNSGSPPIRLADS